MTVAYFDCFAGAGGDMIVASLLDAGCDFAALQSHLGRLPLEGFSLRTESVRRGGIGGTQFHVDVAGEQPARHLGEILQAIDAANLPPRAAERAKRVFQRLGEAEAKVHRVPIDHVHFHEVGAVDSIIDIVGSCVAMELLGVERVICSPIPAGRGTIRTAHGLLPVPAPATAELLRGAAVSDADIEGEATTPTAAALLTTLTEGYKPLPAMDVSAVGYGAGSREGKGVPNLLRVFLGRLDEMGQADSLIELSANIDDSTGQVLGATMDRLLEAGCLDAWATPIYMKKSRPAWTLSVLAHPSDVEEVQKILFEETTTFGVRRHAVSRAKLDRRFDTVETPYGPVRVKVGSRGGAVLTAAPEFADCLAAAEAHHVPVRRVLEAAAAVWREARR